MHRYTVISSDDDKYHLEAMLDKGKHKCPMLSKTQDRNLEFIWDNPDFLYKVFYKDLVLHKKCPYEEIDEVDIEEIYDMFKEADSIGFFNEVKDGII